MKSSVQQRWTRLKGKVTEWLLQNDAESRAAALERDEERARSVKKCLRGADERLELLGELSDPDVALASAGTLREATLLLLEAAAPRSATPDPNAELRRISAELEVSPSTSSAAARLLAIHDPVALGDLSRAELLESARALEDITRALRAYVDGRTAKRIAWSRRLRVGTVGAVISYVVFVTVSAIFGPKNIARGKPVVLSSMDPKSAPPSMLVDGVRSADTPPGGPKPDIVMTRNEGKPWARIDLGAMYRIREVRIYNRDDNSFDEGLPYMVDFSWDGETFWEVGRCEKHFGSWWIDPPCRIEGDHREARYVRVRATGFLALSEVEVLR